MQRLTALLAGLVLAAAPGLAQEDGDAAAIAGVIGGQLEAFNARDVPLAWGFASPTIQSIFGNPGNFGMMVQTGYPMVWTNDGADYLDLRVEADGRLWQLVRLRDADGVPHLLDYAMVETPQGWLIDAVVLLPATDVGV